MQGVKSQEKQMTLGSENQKRRWHLKWILPGEEMDGLMEIQAIFKEFAGAKTGRGLEDPKFPPKNIL